MQAFLRNFGTSGAPSPTAKLKKKQPLKTENAFKRFSRKFIEDPRRFLTRVLLYIYAKTFGESKEKRQSEQNNTLAFPFEVNSPDKTGKNIAVTFGEGGKSSGLSR